MWAFVCVCVRGWVILCVCVFSEKESGCTYGSVVCFEVKYKVNHMFSFKVTNKNENIYKSVFEQNRTSNIEEINK